MSPEFCLKSLQTFEDLFPRFEIRQGRGFRPPPGEHAEGAVGKGFAVVADEVRKLSQKSGESTKEIGEVVEQIRAMSLETGNLMESTEQVIGEGAEATRETGRSFDSIHEAVSALPVYMNEIEKSFESLRVEQEKSRAEVLGIDQFSEQLVSGQKALDQVSSDLRSQAMDLDERIRQFRF